MSNGGPEPHDGEPSGAGVAFHDGDVEEPNDESPEFEAVMEKVYS